MALTRKRKISKRRHWIHPICKDRGALGEFKLLPQILADDEKYLEYFRMTPTTFQETKYKLEEINYTKGKIGGLTKVRTVR
ncbi:hypothetical protein PoB_003671300 [Plakobranchus ocellatus]|uniref:Uncharacterized protein n=1 Tax=Plakobranchus ocellatus TaxID=259542 RepID=A0AAV4AS63_9GAST|nr:hypothetical protein PoB_003671300 [Plakobranchus ocellatus]